MYIPTVGALAQDYPEKDDNGVTIYYKIFSAAPRNNGLCLQDESKNDGKYAYLLAEHERGLYLVEQLATTWGTLAPTPRRLHPPHLGQQPALRSMRKQL